MRAMLRAAVAAMFACCAFAAWAQAPEPVPAKAFFANPAIFSASIAPDGRHVAMNTLGKEGHYQLVVLDTAKMSAVVAASFRDADVVNVHWISDKRLVFGAGDVRHELSDWLISTGLYAVDFDGSEFRQLARPDRGFVDSGSVHAKTLDWTTRFVASMANQDADSIYVTQSKFKSTGEFDSLVLLKLDTRTAATESMGRPGDTLAWAFDRNSVPRLAQVREANGRHAIVAYDGSQWSKLVEFDPFTGEGAFTPVGFAPDGTLYVTSRKGDGTSTLYTYDLKAKRLSDQPVLSIKGFDVHAGLDIVGNKLAGIHYQSDATTTYWFDPAIKEMQAKVDMLLPATVNILHVPLRRDSPAVLVHAYADTDPGEYFIYDSAGGKLVRIARARPDIDPARMAQKELVRIKARDGLEMPVWVTKPRGAKGPLPTVVWVHGGPYLRGGTWAWEADTQFFASRGYAVIEPEFRGSTGYGWGYFRAGWKQWGLAMQDDIADAAKWAAASGIADPRRMCIGGGSYGGYATLMGLAKNPDLYKCGVAYAAVTDLDLMYTASWSDASDEYRTFGMPRLIGDREKDAERLKATSPITVAPQIKQPLLIAHGAQDRRVPIQHGSRFHDEVARSNPNVEWVVYPEEPHGLYLEKDRLDFFTRAEKFLARNIGP